MKPVLQGKPVHFSLTPERLKSFFPEKLRPHILVQGRRITGQETGDFMEALYQVLSRTDWFEQKEFSNLIQKPLAEIAYFYLTQEKNKQWTALEPGGQFSSRQRGHGEPQPYPLRGQPLSREAWPESCGLMANYIYSQTWLQRDSAGP